MDLGVIATVFPVAFLGELPDKTMFASLVMSSRGHSAAVWLGAASAFLLHVVIAVTIGAGVFNLLPDRIVEGIVALLFLGGAVYVLRSSMSASDDDDTAEIGAADPASPRSARRTYLTAFGVVFLAEWGDLTQVLTANMAARYSSPASVAVGALLALWAVAGIAVVGGQGLLRVLPVQVVRRITGVVLLVMAAIAASAAIRG